jgi:outer membrane lipoprotein-sorting protein
VEAKTWIQGIEKSFTEYLAPPREKGTKMLKLEDQLWTYSPDTDRTIKISGHMLRQPVMGSDLSYEDFLEDRKLQDVYTAAVSGEEILNERDCWVLELTAKTPDVAYFSRKLWVDKTRFIPLKEERFAKSGRLLKTTSIKEVMKVGPRWVAKYIIFKDELKSGEGTEIVLESVEFDVEIPDYIFSKAALRK